MHLMATHFLTEELIASRLKNALICFLKLSHCHTQLKIYYSNFKKTISTNLKSEICGNERTTTKNLEG